MIYAVLPAEARHLRFLPGIEDAAGELFSIEDLPEPARSAGRPPEDFEGALNADLLWVIVEAAWGLPVAFLMASVLDGCLHIVEFDVHPLHGRRGVGTRLLDHVLEVARQRAFPAVTLTTFEHVPWNAPYYARHGFDIVGAGEMGDGLAQVLEKEQALGMRRRVAMKNTLRRRDSSSASRARNHQA